METRDAVQGHLARAGVCSGGTAHVWCLDTVRVQLGHAAGGPGYLHFRRRNRHDSHVSRSLPVLWP